MPTITLDNVSGIYLDFKIPNKICLYTVSNVFSSSINNKRVSKLYFLPFSINILMQNVRSEQEVPLRNPLRVSVTNSSA